MPRHLALYATLLLTLTAGCSHTTRQPMGEGCIDGIVRPSDLTFQAESSGREYTVLTADEGSPRLNLRPYAGQRLTICGPITPRFHILHARILPTPPLR